MIMMMMMMISWIAHDIEQTPISSATADDLLNAWTKSECKINTENRNNEKKM